MMQIRAYQPSDAERVKLCIDALREYEATLDPDYRTDAQGTDALLEDIVAAKAAGGEILVAELENVIIGFVSMALERKNDVLITGDVPAVYISDLVVLPEARQQGIGRQLLEAAREFTRAKGITYLKLIVYANNERARRLYEAAGFADYEITMLQDVTRG